MTTKPSIDTRASTLPARSRIRSRVIILATGIAVLGLAGVVVAMAGLSGIMSRLALDPLARFLLAAGLIVLVSHLLGLLAGRLGQPRVVGEIVGGLLLGPSVIGAWWPGLRHSLFAPEVVNSLDIAAQLGLIFFVYLLGADLGAGAHTRGRTTWLVTAGSLVPAFVAGVVIAATAGSSLTGSTHGGSAPVLFFGLAMAITALPVLARILTDLELGSTGVGTLVVKCAAIGDALAWLALTAILLLTGIGEPTDLAITVAVAAVVAFVSAVLVRPGLAKLARRALDRNGQAALPAVVVSGALGYAAISQAIGLHPIIGAFIFGMLVPRDTPAVATANDQLRGFTSVALLPLFFATVGLKTSFTMFGTDITSWLLLMAVLAAAMLAKTAGAAGGALLGGLDHRQALAVGVLMNCRGVTELIVATVGLRLNLVTELGYTLLVLVALITTALTGPLLRMRDGALTRFGLKDGP